MPESRLFYGNNCSADELLNSVTCLRGGREPCDEGADNADLPDRCRTTCELPACGDGIVDAGEECDDGNTESGDGCDAECREES